MDHVDHFLLKYLHSRRHCLYALPIGFPLVLASSNIMSFISGSVGILALISLSNSSTFCLAISLAFCFANVMACSGDEANIAPSK